MRKCFALLTVMIFALMLVGCTPSISITITPNPIEFSSGEDVVNASVTATASGMGPITISRITAVLSEAGDSNVILYSFDSDNEPSFEPINVPFVYNGFTQTFDLATYVGQKTVNSLIAEQGAQFGITSYDQLKGRTFNLKVEVTANTVTSNEVTVKFN